MPYTWEWTEYLIHGSRLNALYMGVDRKPNTLRRNVQICFHVSKINFGNVLGQNVIVDIERTLKCICSEFRVQSISMYHMYVIPHLYTSYFIFSIHSLCVKSLLFVS